jgi:protein-disulfide isomerase
MIKKTIMSLFLGLFLFSCSDLKTLSEDVKKIGQDQSLIIQKLNLLEKKIAEVSKPQAPNNKKDKPKSDPNKVYDIADAGSIILGNPKASVTIVEWTDFQ